MKTSPDDFCKEFFREYYNGSGTTDDIASRYGFPYKLACELIDHGRFLHDLEAERIKTMRQKNDFGLIDDNARYKGKPFHHFHSLLGFELKRLLLQSPAEFHVDDNGNIALLDGNKPIRIYTKIGE